MTGSDPSDPTTKLNRLHRESLKAANEGRADEVVIFNENKFEFYCEVCDTHVLRNSKHCQRCNRCTYEFDHHCLWVGNDIGLHNYGGFMRMLIAVLCTVLLQIGLLSFALIRAYQTAEEDSEIGFMSVGGFKTLNWVAIGVSSLLLLADIYLLSYHVMLISKNTTTYKYIRAQQQISKKKSSIIRELERKPEEQQSNASVLDSEANANSIMDSVQSYDTTDERYKRRITCREIFCCRERRNPMRVRIDKKTEIHWRSNQMVIHLNIDAA